MKKKLLTFAEDQLKARELTKKKAKSKRKPGLKTFLGSAFWQEPKPYDIFDAEPINPTFANLALKMSTKEMPVKCLQSTISTK